MAGMACCLWVWPAAPVAILYGIILLSAFAFCVLNIGYVKLKVYQQQWLGGFLILIILFITGYLLAAKSDDRKHPGFFANQQSTQLLLQINSEPKQSGAYIRFEGLVKQRIYNQHNYASTGKLMLIMPAGQHNSTLEYGDWLLIPANYTSIAPPYNPAEFNYKKYLANQNIYYQAFISPGKYQVVRKAAGNPAIAYALRLRRRLVNRLQKGISNTEAAAVASTLMLGYNAELNPDLVQAYAITGTLHVLSVSGAHVAFIYALISMGLSFLSHSKYSRWFKAIFTIALIWGYALLTGFSPAVCRAVIMLSFFITGKTFYRHTGAVNLLAASAFLLLLYQPLLLADVGFQLSYCAVFGLFVVQPVLQRLIVIENKWLKKVWYLCSVSLAAQLATLPLSVFYFHQFPVYFLISNLLIIIPAELIIMLGGLYLLLYPFSFISAWLGIILKYVILITNKCLIYIEHLPYASRSGIWITPAEALVLGVLVAALVIFAYRKKSPALFAVVISTFILTLSAGFKDYKAYSSHEITFFNIRKHTGVLFRSGNTGIVLTDVIQEDKTFKYSIQPCLDSSRMQKYRLCDLTQNFNSPILRKAGNYIRFLDQSILIVDSAYRYKHLRQPVTIDYIYISGTAKTELNLLAQSYVYHTVIAGAGNSNQAIRELEINTAAQHKKFISLKRNKSFIIASH